MSRRELRRCDDVEESEAGYIGRGLYRSHLGRVGQGLLNAGPGNGSVSLGPLALASKDVDGRKQLAEELEDLPVQVGLDVVVDGATESLNQLLSPPPQA